MVPRASHIDSKLASEIEKQPHRRRPLRRHQNPVSKAVVQPHVDRSYTPIPEIDKDLRISTQKPPLPITRPRISLHSQDNTNPAPKMLVLDSKLLDEEAENKLKIQQKEIELEQAWAPLLPSRRSVRDSFGKASTGRLLSPSNETVRASRVEPSESPLNVFLVGQKVSTAKDDRQSKSSLLSGSSDIQDPFMRFSNIAGERYTDIVDDIILEEGSETQSTKNVSQNFSTTSRPRHLAPVIVDDHSISDVSSEKSSVAKPEPELKTQVVEEAQDVVPFEFPALDDVDMVATRYAIILEARSRKLRGEPTSEPMPITPIDITKPIIQFPVHSDDDSLSTHSVLSVFKIGVLVGTVYLTNTVFCTNRQMQRIEFYHHWDSPSQGDLVCPKVCTIL